MRRRPFTVVTNDIAGMMRAIPYAVRRSVLEDVERLEGQVLGEIAQRLQAEAVDRTIKLDKVVDGEFLAGWDVEQHPDGWELVNNTVHAGIIEMGGKWPSRPPPYAAILEWVEKRIAGGSFVLRDGQTAKQAAHAVRRKIKRDGIAPTFLLRDTMADPQVAAWFADAVRRFM